MQPDPAPAAALACVAADLPRHLRHCTSGQELEALGFPEDTEDAAQLNVSTVVPIVEDGAYMSHTSA